MDKHTYKYTHLHSGEGQLCLSLSFFGALTERQKTLYECIHALTIFVCGSRLDDEGMNSCFHMTLFFNITHCSRGALTFINTDTPFLFSLSVPSCRFIISSLSESPSHTLMTGA